MTIEERIVHIQEAAMEEARMKADSITKQHENMLAGIFNQHRDEAVRQSEVRIRGELINARQQQNMAASRAQIELKREYGKRQKELKKKLFEEVEQKLQEYMKTDEYPRLLIAYIEKAARFADGASMTIYINPTDEDKKKYLEEHTGMTLTVSKEDFVGGVRAVIHEKNVLIDHAFKGAIESEYRKFVFKGGVQVG